MASDFTERKLAWLEAVASDPDMQRLAVVVAVKLATRYLNSKTGDAWPSIDRLARELTANPRNVRRAIASLVESGWLDKRRGGRGRGDSNRYRTRMGGVHAPLTERKRGAHLTEEGGAADRKRRAHTPPEPVSEPGIEPVSSRNHRKTRSSYHTAGRSRSSVHARSNRSKPFPQKWVFGPAEAKIALASSAQWGEVRAGEEFGKFRAYNLKKGSSWADWSEVWKDWCERGDKFSAGPQRRKDKVAGAVDGARAFYDKQEAAIHARQIGEDE